MKLLTLAFLALVLASVQSKSNIFVMQLTTSSFPSLGFRDFATFNKIADLRLSINGISKYHIIQSKFYYTRIVASIDIKHSSTF